MTTTTTAAPGSPVSHRLHLNCTGGGSPAVILEAGNLGMSADWIKIQQRVAETTRVCSYDRAGNGWSDTGESSAAIDQVVQSVRSHRPLL